MRKPFVILEGVTFLILSQNPEAINSKTDLFY